MNVRIVVFKEDMALQNKETTIQSYQKMLNQNTKKSPGIEFALFTCTGEMGMDSFGFLNCSLILLLFCNKPAKKNYGIRTLTLTTGSPLSRRIRASAF